MAKALRNLRMRSECQRCEHCGFLFEAIALFRLELSFDVEGTRVVLTCTLFNQVSSDDFYVDRLHTFNCRTFSPCLVGTQ